MERLVLQGPLCLDGRRRTLILDQGRIEEVMDGIVTGFDSDRTVECSDLLVMPGLCNCHTHAPMTLLKGIGEDLELERWLNDRIWPLEAKLGPDHLKAGMALACLEMIRTGTTLFNDMYFMQGEVASVVADMGMRAVLGEGFLDLFDEERREHAISETESSLKAIDDLDCSRVTGAIAPHAVYTVSPDGLIWCHDEAVKRDLKLHVHISETQKEVEDCMARTGKTPVEELNEHGILDARTLGAHCVHLTDRDLDIIQRKESTAVHLPVSNMKLSVGGQLRYPEMKGQDIGLALGTDGSASNNSLDMFSSMKTMGLLCKQNFGASSITSADVISHATEAGYRALGMKGGCLKEGWMADIILLDLKDPSMVPMHDPSSNIVYSINSRSVKYNIVDGQIIMDNGYVQGQEGIIDEAIRCSKEIAG